MEAENEQNVRRPDYCRLIECANDGLDGANSYLFYPGMEFLSREKWWPDAGFRPTPHEGIDFCYYIDAEGEEQRFTPEVNIPAMAVGEIFAICRDFLGQSVFVDHGGAGSERFLSIYAHMVPGNDARIGQQVEAGECLGTVADTRGRKNRMPAHLHLSLMYLGREVSPKDCDWKMIGGWNRHRLIDPVTMMGTDRMCHKRRNHWKERGLREMRRA